MVSVSIVSCCGSVSSEAHTYLPRVGCQNLVLLPYDAGVRPLVDGVGHNAYVIVLQGNVARVRELQQLAVFIPATKGRVVKVSESDERTMR